MTLAAQLDLVGRDLIEGWCRLPGPPARLIVYRGDTPIGTTIANRPRPDLAAAGHGDCAFSFLVPLEADLTAEDRISLRIEGTGLFLMATEGTRVELS